jgi:hypothetical protein
MYGVRLCVCTACSSAQRGVAWWRGVCVVRCSLCAVHCALLCVVVVRRCACCALLVVLCRALCGDVKTESN